MHKRTLLEVLKWAFENCSKYYEVYFDKEEKKFKFNHIDGNMPKISFTNRIKIFSFRTLKDNETNSYKDYKLVEIKLLDKGKLEIEDFVVDRFSPLIANEIYNYQVKRIIDSNKATSYVIYEKSLHRYLGYLEEKYKNEFGNKEENK